MEVLRQVTTIKKLGAQEKQSEAVKDLYHLLNNPMGKVLELHNRYEGASRSTTLKIIQGQFKKPLDSLFPQEIDHHGVFCGNQKTAHAMLWYDIENSDG